MSGDSEATALLLPNAYVFTPSEIGVIEEISNGTR
jgi:hypothetical protein